MEFQSKVSTIVTLKIGFPLFVVSTKVNRIAGSAFYLFICLF